MQDTEKYLNSILERRLGSIPNAGGFSKNSYNVTRLPRKEQKIDSMPTVFRVKTETIYRNTGVMPGVEQSKNPLMSAYNSKQPPLPSKNSQGQKQRVEYVAISKRIDVGQQELKAPTVDVSKYRKTGYVPPEEVKHNPQEYLSTKLSQASMAKGAPRDGSHFGARDGIDSRDEIGSEATITKKVQQSKSQRDGNRKRRIFGNSREKIRQDFQ